MSLIALGSLPTGRGHGWTRKVTPETPISCSDINVVDFIGRGVIVARDFALSAAAEAGPCSAGRIEGWHDEGNGTAIHRKHRRRGGGRARAPWYCARPACDNHG